jgi:FkbM family methyltransferase
MVPVLLTHVVIAGAVAARSRRPPQPETLRVVESIKQKLRPIKARWSRSPAPSWHATAAVMRRHGLLPRTIFDVGVAFGTYELYREFPDAFYYLVDPTAESLRYMRQLARQLRCKMFNVALSDRNGEMDIEVRPDIQGSTFFEEVGPREILRRETVAVRRFDTLVGSFERPALAKIDVQGSELAVLEGMGERIGEFDAIIVETSTLATIKGGPELYDLMAFMKERGFVASDVLGYARRPLDNALAQIDMLFVPESSPLRTDRRWAATV